MCSGALIFVILGFPSSGMTSTSDLSFLPKDSSGYKYFIAGVQKVFEAPNVTMKLSYKSRRADGLGLLMEAQGIIGSEPDVSVWVTYPVALLGSQWKEFNEETQIPDLAPDSEALSPIMDEGLMPTDGGSTESLNMDVALCHICDRFIPVLLFESHNVLCLNVHKSEMDLTLIHDSLDDMKIQIDLKKKFIEEELSRELVVNESDALSIQEQKQYISCLKVLGDIAIGFSDKLGKVLSVSSVELNLAKKRFEGPALGVIDMEQLLWDPPPMESLFPSKNVEFKSLNMVNNECDVKDQLEQIGNFFWQTIVQFSQLLEIIRDRMSALRQSTVAYQQAFLQEENVKDEIEAKSRMLPGASAHKPPGNFMLKSADAQSDYMSVFTGDSLQAESLPPSSPRSSAFSEAIMSTSPDWKTLNPDSKKPARPRIVVNTDKVVDIQRVASAMSVVSGDPLDSPVHTPSLSVIPTTVPSIRDYEIVKPISKGAFGSVYLARKKVTGDYYAVKVLKKADMIAKNQVTNIKAERMILTQLDSPYVVKLYYSFQSRNHLYLVMEYLNGGDCASLLKAVGCLDEKWARQYVSEMTLGLEFLHSMGIVHR